MNELITCTQLRKLDVKQFFVFFPHFFDLRFYLRCKSLGFKHSESEYQSLQFAIGNEEIGND